MNLPIAGKTLDLLAALSHGTNLSIGCYCENEARCHRSVLRELLRDRGATLRRHGRTIEAAVANGQDFVPHRSRSPTHIPFVNVLRTKGTSYDSSSPHPLSHP